MRVEEERSSALPVEHPKDGSALPTGDGIGEKDSLHDVYHS